MRKLLLSAAPLLFALAGCIPVPYAYTVTTCRVEGFPALIGRAADGETAKEILRVSGARTLRWIQPGMPTTGDYNPERVTAWLGADNRIARLNCG
jgi:hypothetical protein